MLARFREWLAVICLFALLSTPLHADFVVTDLAQPMSIAGQWKFQTGDDPNWALAKLDDSDWQSTPVPAHSPEGYYGYSGMLWYRLKLKLDLDSPSVAKNAGTLAITLGNVMSAYQLFAGGELIGEVGGLPPQQEAVYDWRPTFSIPASAVSENGELILALRVWRSPNAGPDWETGPNYGDFLLGNVGDLKERSVRKAILPFLILAVLYLVVGLYHLLIARRNPSLKEFFFFGLLAIAVAIYTFETSQARFFLDIPFWLHKRLEYLSLYLTPILFGQALLALTRTPGNKFTQGFNIVFALHVLVILLIPGETVFHLTISSFRYLAPIWALSMAVIMGMRAYKGSRMARGVVVLLLMLAAAGVNDTLLETALIGSGNTVYIVFALVLFILSLMMAERYTDILKNLERVVTERTSELTKANQELEAAVETKSNFMANMSHEMRTPMNAILGLTHLGLKTDLDAQQRDYFNKVEQSAEGLKVIIDSILDFSKLEEGELECVNQPFSPVALAESIRLVWTMPAEQAGLEFEIQLDPELPAAVVGDEVRLKQALNNFLSNAVKFTEQGKITLGLSVLNQDENTVNLRFAVSDTGMGIADDQREELFNAFSQADNTMTRAHGGTGLGLSIASRLVSLMNGSIELESSPGVGSTFSFDLTLPVAQAMETSEEDSAELDLSPIFGAKVLLVDDSELNLQVASELLRLARLRVDMALDGKQAVEMVNATLDGQSYDCVLMDVQMPVMNGYTATEQIRAQAQFSDLPVLAMTANASPQDRERGTEAGMNAYIPKPIDPDELYRALLKWIPADERDYDETLFTEALTTSGDLTELPDSLPGIEIKQGLARVGGNSVLYLKLLQDLCKDYADVPARIKALLTDDKPNDAQQLAHKLRGIANNLGLNELGESAGQIEAKLKSGEELGVDALSALEHALGVASSSQASLPSSLSSSEELSELGQDERQELIRQLIEAVEENNPEALELVEKLLVGMDQDSEGFDALSAAGEALDMYDFAGAMEQLQTMK